MSTNPLTRERGKYVNTRLIFARAAMKYPEYMSNFFNEYLLQNPTLIFPRGKFIRQLDYQYLLSPGDKSIFTPE